MPRAPLEDLLRPRAREVVASAHRRPARLGAQHHLLLGERALPELGHLRWILGFRSARGHAFHSRESSLRGARRNAGDEAISRRPAGSLYDPLVIASACLTLALYGQTATSTPVETGEWRLGDSVKFAMQATGHATEPEGAFLSIRSISDPGRATGSVTARLSAITFRGHRVRLSAELLSAPGSGGALLIRADAGPTVAITIQNSLPEPVRSEHGWSARSVSIPVPDNATVLAFGVLLQGGGSVSARGLRLETGEPLTDAPISEPARVVLEEAISLVKMNALLRDSINWKVVEPQVRALAGGARKPSEVYAAIQWLLTQLADSHSYFVPAASVKEFWAPAENRLPVIRVLPDGVGYVSLSGYAGGDQDSNRAYIMRVHSSLDSIAPRVRCGFVVDLRGNTKGDMWPMLASLRPFLGSQRLGTFGDPSGPSPPWITGDSVGAMPPETLKALETARVAVLTGSGTVGAGEAVTIAFRGRPQTRSFGQPTVGTPTANSAFPLSDGALILMTTGLMADRTGRRYGARVEPDEVVAAPLEPDDVQDLALAAAIRWLQKSPSCAGTSR